MRQSRPRPAPPPPRAEYISFLDWCCVTGQDKQTAADSQTSPAPDTTTTQQQPQRRLRVRASPRVVTCHLPRAPLPPVSPHTDTDLYTRHCRAGGRPLLTLVTRAGTMASVTKLRPSYDCCGLGVGIYLNSVMITRLAPACPSGGLIRWCWSGSE